VLFGPISSIIASLGIYPNFYYFLALAPDRRILADLLTAALSVRGDALLDVAVLGMAF